MSISAVDPIETLIQPVASARALAGRLGSGSAAEFSSQLCESGLLDLIVEPVEHGSFPSVVAEVVRVLAVSRRDAAERVRLAVLDSQRADSPAAEYRDVTDRLLSVAVEVGVAAQGMHRIVGDARDATDGQFDSRVVRRIGEVAVAVSAAEAALAAAAVSVDALWTSSDDPLLLRAEAIAAIGGADVLAARAAVTVEPVRTVDDSAALIELGTWTLTGSLPAR